MSVFRTAAVALLFAAVAVPVASKPAQAQDNAVAGRVRVAGTSEPIPGVQITVTGGAQRATTDAQGAFRLTGLTGTNVTLDVRRIGYRSERISARVGQTDLVVSLVSTPANLDAVVVTGTAGAQQRREIGNSVGVINAADVVETAPILSMQGLLNGRTPSLVVLPTSGQVGTGSQVRIRGQSSLSLGNNPLLFVDGVRVNNAVATGPVSQAFGSAPISRLNDFNPSDIESIEVLKGPSAATLYGTEAANGVINIITKKGSASAPRWNFSTRQGVNYFADWKTRFPQNYGRRRLTTDAPAGAATGPVEAMVFDSLLVGACGDSLATRAGKGTRREVEFLRRASLGQPVFWSGAEAFTDAEKRRLLSPRLRRLLAGVTSFDAIKPIRDRFDQSAPDPSHLNWMSYVDLHLRLPELLLMRVDKMTMSVGLEARVPFLDHRMVGLAMSIPSALKTKNGTLKYILKKAVTGLIPDDLITRRKQGFGVPVNELFEGPLAAMADAELRRFCGDTDLLDRAEVAHVMRTADASKRWYLLNLAMWWRTFIAGDSPAVPRPAAVSA